jgi:hypothetical protein
VNADFVGQPLVGKEAYAGYAPFDSILSSSCFMSAISSLLLKTVERRQCVKVTQLPDAFFLFLADEDGV